MASPCEILLDTQDRQLATRVAETVAAEAWRVEQKFSRYRDDSLLYQINHSDGVAIAVDDETARLLDFADRAYQLSRGAFDVTSGILRKIWRFDGSDNVPPRKAAKALLSSIGWQKVSWQDGVISLPAGMEIDLGGLGKEYAVDRAAQLALEVACIPLLVNFGGDLFASSPPSYKSHWDIGVDTLGGGQSAIIQMKQGGLATSGDANRYLLRKGVRYSHVLNPRTGWPVMDAPRSITVAAPSCIDAGMLATFAMLKGRGADDFLRAQDVLYWLQD